MQLRQLGRNGPTVSALGLGCMGMSDFYGSAATRDDAESVATLRAALDAGVTLLDTADFYGVGHNELLLRQALEGRRERAFISVKCGVLRTPAGGFSGFDGRPQSIKNFAAYSLQRLNVEAIDLYQPARIDPAVPIEDTVGACRRSDQGRQGPPPRALGGHGIAAAPCSCGASGDRAADRISLATRLIERDILPAARELGIGIVGYAPLSRGLLSGALDGSFAPGDFRAHAPHFSGENFARNQARVEVLRTLATKHGATPAQIAIAWVLAQGQDIVPIVGTTKRARLTENLAALQVQLDAAELAALNTAFAPETMAGERYAAPQMGVVAR